MSEPNQYSILWPNRETGETEVWKADPQQFIGFLRSMNVLEAAWNAMLQSSPEKQEYWTTGGRDA